MAESGEQRSKRKKRPVGQRAATAAAAPARPKKTEAEREAEEKEQIALGLKADGYNSAVVTRKMIQIHGMAEADAEALVGRIYGKKVNARAGDTTVAVISGIAMAVASLAGILFLLYFVGFFPWFVIFIYLGLLGVMGKGVTQALIAIINVNSKEELVKKD